MALNLIDKLHAQARKATQDDVNKICHSLLSALHVADKGAESMALLRQLFFILQAQDSNTNLPSKLIISMINTVGSAEKGRMKECLMCQRIINELLPLDDSFDSEAGKLKDKIPSPLHLQLFQDKECIAKIFSKAVKWLHAQDLEFEIERKVFTFLVGVSLLHSYLLTPDKVKGVNEKLGSWLQEASLYQAPNPYSSNPFRKDQNNLVTEVDGTASTNFFTVLSIGQYYTDDQLVNIYSFSMLYQWINQSYESLLYNEQTSHDDGDDDDDISIEGELELYRSQAQPIRPSSRSSWLSKSVSIGWGSSPTSQSSVEKQGTPVRKTKSLGYSKNADGSSPVSLTKSDQDQRSNVSSRSVTPSEHNSREESLVRSDSISSSGSIGPQQGTTTPDSPQCTNLKTLADSLTRESTLTELSKTTGSRGTTPTKQRPLTPADVLRPSVIDDNMAGSETRASMKRVFDTLNGRTIDYCFRILDQCDRKPKVQSDAELQNACQLETVKLLDLVCKIDSGLIPKTFRELKRLVTISGQDDNNPKLLIVIVQFLLNHSRAVAYDPQQELKTLFHRVLSHNFNSHNVSFDIIMFILDNLETLTLDYNIMSTYFPNIVKILAWNPHTFVMDFMEIVPAMMSSVTSLEVLHSLIDLPCMTVALEIMEKTKNMDFTALPPSIDQDPVRAIDAFKNAMFRPMFNFFTRAEGGHGDTINRLDQFHTSIQDMIEHPRVLVCYQAVPVLLKVWFSVILEEGSEEFASNLLAVLMERTGLVYGIEEYKKDIRRILSENTVLLLKKFPQIVLQQRAEISEFLSGTRNITGQESFFCQLVWGVGEYMSTAYSNECTAEVIGHMYETLEVLTYEVIAITGTTPPSQAPFTVCVVSTLMSTLAKLASRCQDLIPRAILSLTKVARQHKTDLLEKEDQEILLNKAQELINLLKLPNFASVILNPSTTLETDRVHLDRTSMATLLRTTHRLVAPTL